MKQRPERKLTLLVKLNIYWTTEAHCFYKGFKNGFNILWFVELQTFRFCLLKLIYLYKIKSEIEKKSINARFSGDFFFFFAQCWQAVVDIYKCTWILNSRNNNYINPWHLFTNVTLVQLLCETQIWKDVGSGEICSRYGGQYLARATSDNPPALNVSHCQSTSASPISLGAESQPRVRQSKKMCFFSPFFQFQ